MKHTDLEILEARIRKTHRFNERKMDSGRIRDESYAEGFQSGLEAVLRRIEKMKQRNK